ncbi:atp4 subunit B of the stator stalk of mitochondrial F1F0 ATP synthase [Kappamyces sp. JEL0680]|nr:atp4 subunit B of the stator stalk of mitochondrial F1F0 ATP synthase [Kappamyces sp. JEL0680]
MTSIPLTQNYSTERKAPDVVATSLLSAFPGDSLAAKSSNVLLTASVAAFLVSKEIYLVDGEFFEMLCIFGAYYVWFSGGKDMAAAYFADKQKTIKGVLEQARVNHKAVVQERIDHIGKLSETVNTTEALYEISKDMAKLEAEAFELKQQLAFTQDVKSTLDSWVRQEAALREAEQVKLASQVIEAVKAKLADPKLQTSVLNQSIADLEKLTLSK